MADDALNAKILASKEQLTNLKEKAKASTSPKGLDLIQANRKSVLGCKLIKPPPLSYYVPLYNYISLGPNNIKEIPSGIIIKIDELVD